MAAAKKPKLGSALAEHIFLDIVGYSRRTIESQASIIETLNRIVKRAAGALRLRAGQVIYIPTGDGICIALLNLGHPYDIQMRLALKILERLRKHNSKETDEQLRFEVRIGINLNRDNVFVDINGNRNVAGAGINDASRIMGKADGGQIMIGNSVFDTLKLHNRYIAAFRPFIAVVKHGVALEMHQFVGQGYPFLNADVPRAFRASLPAASVPIAAPPHDDDRTSGESVPRTRLALRKEGLTIGVEIGPAQADREWAEQVGLEPKRALRAVALVDTGAAVTVINPQIALACGLRPVGEVVISTPGGVSKVREYAGAIRFPGSKLSGFDPVRFVAGPLQGPYACLLGRDVLDSWRLTYDGPAGKAEIQERS
jgi:class 3 adenylate cyclase/predicted aspartyl protease